MILMKTRTILSPMAKKPAAFTAAILAAVILLASVTISAVTYPTHDRYVSDSAEILDETTIETVRNTSETLNNERGTRIAVCTVTGTDSESVRDYAAGVFKEWQIGNGVLLLLVKYPEGSENTDTFYAVQSNSIADTLTNAKLSEILNTCLESSFAAGNFAEGTSTTVKALAEFLTQNLPEDFADKSASSGMPGWLSLILKIVVAVAILLIAGYILLVILERRQAKRRRMYLEERRRMARDGHGAYRPAQSGGRRPGPGTSHPYPNGSSTYQRSAVRGYESAAYPDDYSMQGYNGQQMRGNNQNYGNEQNYGRSYGSERNYGDPYNERVQDSGYYSQSYDRAYGQDYHKKNRYARNDARLQNRENRTANASQYESDNRYDPQTAATVQINTADIRAYRAPQRDGRRQSREDPDRYSR